MQLSQGSALRDCRPFAPPWAKSRRPSRAGSRLLESFTLGLFPVLLLWSGRYRRLPLRLAVGCLALMLFLVSYSLAQDIPQAYVGARIIPINGPDFPEGVLIVQQGKIVAVGPSRSTGVPAGAQRHDVKGRVIMPGLVDTHSHIGGVEGADSTAPIQPDVRVLDSINVRSLGIQKAQAGGITTANVMPGSGHLLSGQTLYLKLRDGGIIDDLLIHDGKGNISGGLKMANGTNSRREPPFPGTRAKSAALVREQYVKAQEYQEKLRRANGDREKMPERDLRMETLVEVLEGKRTVHHHTHRHDDVLTAIRLAKEFGFRMVLQHVSEAWKLVPEIAASGFPVSLIVLDSPGGKLEAMDVSNRTGAVLEKAGVLTGFHTDDVSPDSAVVPLDVGGIRLDGSRSQRHSLPDLQAGRDTPGPIQSKRHCVGTRCRRSTQRSSSSAGCLNRCHHRRADSSEVLCLHGTASSHRQGHCRNAVGSIAAGARGIRAHPSHHHSSLPGCDRSAGRDPVYVYGWPVTAGRAVETSRPCGCGHLAREHRATFFAGRIAGAESLSSALQPRGTLYQFRALHGSSHVYHRVSRAGQDSDRSRHDADGVGHSGRELCGHR